METVPIDEITIGSGSESSTEQHDQESQPKTTKTNQTKDIAVPEVQKGITPELSSSLQEVIQSMGVEIVSFDDTKATEKEFPVFKAQEKRHYRIGLPIPFFVKVKSHFCKRRFICNGGACCDLLKPPDSRFGTPIVVYETDSKGNLTAPFDYTIQCMICGEDRANYIQQQHKEWDLSQYDLGLYCSEAQYQKMDISVKKGAAWAADPRFREKILAEATKYLKWVSDRVAATLTEKEIRDLVAEEKGGQAGPSPRETVISQKGDVDFASLFSK